MLEHSTTVYVRLTVKQPLGLRHPSHTLTISGVDSTRGEVSNTWDYYTFLIKTERMQLLHTGDVKQCHFHCEMHNMALQDIYCSVTNSYFYYMVSSGAEDLTKWANGTCWSSWGPNFKSALSTLKAIYCQLCLFVVRAIWALYNHSFSYIWAYFCSHMLVYLCMYNHTKIYHIHIKPQTKDSSKAGSQKYLEWSWFLFPLYISPHSLPPEFYFCSINGFPNFQNESKMSVHCTCLLPKNYFVDKNGCIHIVILVLNSVNIRI